MWWSDGAAAIHRAAHEWLPSLVRRRVPSGIPLSSHGVNHVPGCCVGVVGAGCVHVAHDGAPLRVAEFDELFASALPGVQWPEPHRLRLEFVSSTAVATRAADLVVRGDPVLLGVHLYP